jgi:hypothetical protein
MQMPMEIRSRLLKSVTVTTAADARKRAVVHTNTCARVILTANVRLEGVATKAIIFLNQK